MVGDARRQANVRDAVLSDAQAIVDIYNHYVEHTTVTFEEEPVLAPEMARRIAEVQCAPLPWLVAEEGQTIAGYAYASKWRARSAYRFSVEITVYVAPDCTGGGLGSQLYGELIPRLRAAGLRVLIAGIALPNPASVALHEKFALRKVAHFSTVGFKFNHWIDVGYWQRTL